MSERVPIEFDMKGFGYFLLGVGLVAMIGAFFYPVAVNTYVGEPVVNAGRLAVRTMLHASAAATAIIGAVFAAAGSLREAILARPLPLKQADAPVTA